MEVTLTGVCHCPRQIISSAARYTHTPPTFTNLPQDERPAIEVACMYSRASACADELVFVPAFRIMHSCG